jgi:hypothetical protein
MKHLLIDEGNMCKRKTRGDIMSCLSGFEGRYKISFRVVLHIAILMAS